MEQLVYLLVAGRRTTVWASSNPLRWGSADAWELIAGEDEERSGGAEGGPLTDPVEPASNVDDRTGLEPCNRPESDPAHTSVVRSRWMNTRAPWAFVHT